MQANLTKHQFLVESVLSHGDRPDCLIWPFSKVPKGYGKLMVPGEGLRYAHKISYGLFIGPTDHELRNLCGNNSCYHPDHWKAREYRSYYDYLIQALASLPADGSCVEWPFCRTHSGYGHLRRNGVDLVVSREAYRLTYGSLPEGFEACHKCDNPPCFRPDHLFAGTPSDNMTDCSAKGRLNNGSKHGDEHPCATVTGSQVLEMRELFASGASVQDLSVRFGIGRSGVRHIVHGRSWKHL